MDCPHCQQTWDAMQIEAYGSRAQLLEDHLAFDCRHFKRGALRSIRIGAAGVHSL